MVANNNFDHIEVEDTEGNTGVIVPLFKEQQSVNAFDFSIDLGTSNTHIEYRVNNGPTSQVFSYEQIGKPYSEFFTPSMLQFNGRQLQDDLLAEQSLMERDFLPLAVSQQSDFHFPTRTVLSAAQTTKWHEIVRPFGLVNIPLTYDKRESYLYNRNIYNIKWGKGEMLRVMESYVETLMLMIRNKVLIEQGDLLGIPLTTSTLQAGRHPTCRSRLLLSSIFSVAMPMQPIWLILISVAVLRILLLHATKRFNT